jgi:hypothetical protein
VNANNIPTSRIVRSADSAADNRLLTFIIPHFIIPNICLKSPVGCLAEIVPGR